MQARDDLSVTCNVDYIWSNGSSEAQNVKCDYNIENNKFLNVNPDNSIFQLQCIGIIFILSLKFNLSK